MDPGRVGPPTVRLDLPATLTVRVKASQAGTTTAALLRLPAGIGVVEGRVLVPASSAQVQGVVALGTRRARTLPLRRVAGGVRFAVYRLDAHRASTIAVVLTPRGTGPVVVRVLIDAAGDGAGHRVRPSGARASGGTDTGRPGSATAGAQGPRRAALITPRDVLRDGRISARDVDAARAAWIVTRESRCCRDGAAGRVDANDDGCLDALDLQALVGATGIRVGPDPPSRGPGRSSGPRPPPGSSGCSPARA